MTMTRRAWTIGTLALASACQARPAEDAQVSPPSLVDSYLAIGSILAADRTEGIGPLATELAAAARAEPGLDPIVVAASEIASLELEPARARYREISHALLPWFDAHPDPREHLRLAYCPMAFAFEGGYWLQRGEPLANPYEGSRMLRCGTFLSWDEGLEHRARWAAAHAGAR